MLSGYYRYPTLCDETVVFVCEDDLWTVPAGGGIARRLTSNLGEVTRPWLSPDGRHLAFVGREEGQAEIYLMPAIGGPARRLTFRGSSQCLTAGWTSQGRILFADNAGQPFPSLLHLYSIDPNSLAVEKITAGPARSISYGPQGGVVIGRLNTEPAMWKRYRGGTAGQFWVDPTGLGEFVPLLGHLHANLANPMWLPVSGSPEGRVYFISDHEGVGNLYSCLPDGSDLCRHTDHEDFYTRNPTTDGRRIVYHCGAELYLYDPGQDVSRQIPLEFYSPQTQRNRKFVDASHYLEDYQLHPSGQALVISSRGQVFTFANWEGAVTQHAVTPPGEEEPAQNGLEMPGPGLVADRMPLPGQTPSNSMPPGQTPTGLTPTGVRYRLPRWLSDGRRLIAVSDWGGEESLIVWNASGKNPGSKNGGGKNAGGKFTLERFTDLDIGRPENIAVNPAKDQIVFSNHRYELLFLDLETRALKLIDRGLAAPIAGFDWSPDGEWVVYSVSVSLKLQSLKLWKAATGETYPLTRPVLRDVAPAFDPRGRFIFFLSHRTFDPVYDNLHFDLNFPRGMRPYLITLQKDQPSPFIPRPFWSDEEDEEAGDGSKSENAPTSGDTSDPTADPNPANPADPEEVPSPLDGSAIESSALGVPTPPEVGEPALPGKDQEPAQDPAFPSAGSAGGEEPEEDTLLQIDLEGIQDRVLPFPVPDGLYRQILGAHDGGVLYSRFPLEGALSAGGGPEPEANGSLVTYNFKDQREETLVNGITDFDLTPNGSTVVYRSGNDLRIFKAAEKPNNDARGANRRSGWIDLDRVKVSVLPGAEWRQMFREAWRLQRDQFWTPDMSQVDWVAIHDRYLPLVDRVSSRREFSDLMWEMQGELGTSHAYEGGGDYRPAPNWRLGFLGADFAFHAASGGWQITHLVAGDPWNPWAHSPLSSPGANVQNGDILLAINGRTLGLTLPPAAALINLAGEEVTLTILPGSPGENEMPSKRTVTVKTLYTESMARYREWVEANRRRVYAATGERVGYIHIPDMGPFGYAEFHRSYLAEVDRQGLIVDVRFNSGGNVSSLLLEKLARRRLGYSKSRWGQVPFPYPEEASLGPMLALTNEHAGSDGDVFCHGFKLMKLGPLLGKRTWGGVVGYLPRQHLADGTQTTQPEYSFWFNDVGWGVENYGTEPDIVVEDPPQDYARGIDTQLERAILEILKLLEKNPPPQPVFAQVPNRAAPRLPKR